MEDIDPLTLTKQINLRCLAMFTFRVNFRPAAKQPSAVFFLSEIVLALFPRQKLQHLGQQFPLKKFPLEIRLFFGKFFRELSFFEYEDLRRFDREKALLY